MFSATMPKAMAELSRDYLADPVRVEVSPPGKVADKITQSVHFLEKSEKPAKLRDILSGDLEATTLVFARTKHGAEKLSKSLIADGYTGRKGKGGFYRLDRSGGKRVKEALDLATGDYAPARKAVLEVENFLEAVVLSAQTALAEDCSDYPGGIIDGAEGTPAPSQLQIDRNCTIRNFPASNPLNTNFSFLTQPGQTDQRWIVIFDNVVHTGDTFRTTGYPYIDVRGGGSFLGTIRAHDLLIDISDLDTKILPGHGVVVGVDVVRETRDMLLTLRRQRQEWQEVERKPAAGDKVTME